MLKLRLDKKFISYYWLFFLMVAKFLLPYFIARVVESHMVIDFGFTLFSILLMLAFFVSRKRVVKPTIILIVLIYVTLIFSTMINHGSLFHVFWHSVQVILLCILVDTISDEDIMLDAFLTMVRGFTLVFFVINFIVMAILPEGIPSISVGKLLPWYLYGNVNSTIKYILPGICCSLILDNRKNRKFSISSFILMAGIIVSALTVYFTATAVIGDVIIMLWILGYKWFSKKTWRKYSLVYGVSILFELFVVLSTGTTAFTTFITTLFRKSITFSGRTYLWAREYLQFIRQPIFGYGYVSFADTERIIGNGNGAHNYYLDLLYQRGVVGLVVFALLLLIPIIRGWKRNSESKTIYIITGVCCACAVMFLSEPFYVSENLVIPMFYILFSSFSNRYLSVYKGARA